MRSFSLKAGLELLAAVAFLTWSAAPAAATEWIKLPAQRVAASAQLVAVGRFGSPAPGEGRGVVAQGVLWQLTPFTVDYYLREPGVLQKLDVGVEADYLPVVAGRRYLVLLEQQRGEWVPVAGPNGLVPMERDEPALADEQDRQFYLRLLAVEKRYPPFGREQSRPALTRQVIGVVATVVALALGVRLAAAGGRRLGSGKP